jgi:hypothetical protein
MLTLRHKGREVNIQNIKEQIMDINKLFSEEQKYALENEDRRELEFCLFLGNQIKKDKSIAKKIDLDLYLENYK